MRVMTWRALVISPYTEGWPQAGVGAEISTMVMEDAFDYLVGPAVFNADNMNMNMKALGLGNVRLVLFNAHHVNLGFRCTSDVVTWMLTRPVPGARCTLHGIGLMVTVCDYGCLKARWTFVKHMR
jgi:hypothetical protein